MVLFGVGEIMGGFFIGFFIDKFSSRFAVMINLVLIVVMGGVTLLFINQFSYNFLAYLMCFLWGFQDSAVHTHTFEILGFQFEDNYTPFSLFGIIESLGCFICQLIIANLKTQSEFSTYTIAQTIVALVFCSITFFFPFNK